MGRSTLNGILAAAGTAAAIIAFPLACGGGTSSSRPDGGPVCTTGDNSCAPGTLCTNGNCVSTCAPDGGGCGATQYCEVHDPQPVCADVTPITCSLTQQCPPPQVCQNGFCVSRQPLADGGSGGCRFSSPVDGGANTSCGPDALCYATTNINNFTTNTCIALAHCPQTGDCPVGGLGSVCNETADGGFYFAGKERLCLASYCVADKNCPSLAICFFADLNNPLGYCSAGIYTNPCRTIHDCPGATGCGYVDPADGGFNDAGPPDGSVGVCYVGCTPDAGGCFH
jgi:hypothetical protein